MRSFYILVAMIGYAINSGLFTLAANEESPAADNSSEESAPPLPVMTELIQQRITQLKIKLSQ